MSVPSVTEFRDGNFGESLGIPTSIPQGSLGMALGLPSQGCEFGACGAGGLGFGDDVSKIPSNITVNIPPQVWFWATHGRHSKVGGLWHYGNWCGVGGAGTPINDTDASCLIHDYCYELAGVTAGDNISPVLNPQQATSLQQCNEALCHGVSSRAALGPANESRAAWDIYDFFVLVPREDAACH